MRPYRDIATLAAAQVICFLALTHMEPSFFLLHFYQAVVYMAILVMLFYMEDRWAYMLGMLAPAVWLGLAYATGLLAAGMRQFGQLAKLHAPTNFASFMGGVTAILAVLMIAFNGQHWKREYAGLRKGFSTFLIILGIVAVYYSILVIWFWNMIPRVVTTN